MVNAFSSASVLTASLIMKLRYAKLRYATKITTKFQWQTHTYYTKLAGSGRDLVSAKEEGKSKYVKDNIRTVVHKSWPYGGYVDVPLRGR